METRAASAQNPVRVLALCGSLRLKSATRKALRIALEGAEAAGAEVILADLAEYDLRLAAGEKAWTSKGPDFPRLHREIQAAQGIILGTPEYHGSFSGVLKNALDHFEIDDFAGKLIGLVAVGGGKQGANGALTGLRAVAKALKAWTLPEDASIPEAHKAFGDEGRPTDPSLDTRLRELGANVARFAALHSGAALRTRAAGSPGAPGDAGAEPILAEAHAPVAVKDSLAAPELAATASPA